MTTTRIFIECIEPETGQGVVIAAGDRAGRAARSSGSIEERAMGGCVDDYSMSNSAWAAYREGLVPASKVSGVPAALVRRPCGPVASP